MSFLLPKLVGEITVKQRKSRYHGEPVYKTLSFVKQKPKKIERWEVVRTAPAAQHITWEQLSPEQQQYFWEQHQRGGGHHHHHPHASVETLHHHRPLLEIEPEIKLIKPKPKVKKVDAAYAIFSESDSESTYSGSSRTSFGSSKSSKSSRSETSSSSSRSSRSSRIGPVTGW